MKNLFCVFLLINLLACKSSVKLDLPIEDYKKEITALSPEDYYSYWKNLNDYDQNIVLNAETVKAYDSLSLITLIKSALLYELKGNDILKVNLNPNNEILFIHNLIPQSNLDFWPILMKQKEVNNTLLIYPSYQLEGIAGSFYDYSVYGQDTIYDKLISKLNSRTYGKASDALINTYLEQKRIYKLSEVENIGKWKRQRFIDKPETSELGNFELTKMSDGHYYFRIRNERLNLLETIEKNESAFIFRVKNEPFDWYYVLDKTGNLTLYNAKGKVLINYKKAS